MADPAAGVFASPLSESGNLCFLACSIKRRVDELFLQSHFCTVQFHRQLCGSLAKLSPLPQQVVLSPRFLGSYLRQRDELPETHGRFNESAPEVLPACLPARLLLPLSLESLFHSHANCSTSLSKQQIDFSASPAYDRSSSSSSGLSLPASSRTLFSSPSSGPSAYER